MVQYFRKEFQVADTTNKLILTHILVNVILHFIWFLLLFANAWVEPELYRTIERFFLFSTDWFHNLTHPWAPLTYMFMNGGWINLFWDMLYLYWFGKIFSDLIGEYRLFSFYLLAGLIAALVFSFSCFILGVKYTRFMQGSGGAIIAIQTAVLSVAPNYYISLPIIGKVKLKYFVALTFIPSLFAVALGLLFQAPLVENIDSEFPTAIQVIVNGFFGWYFVRLLKRGNDITSLFNDFISYFFKRKPKGNT